MATRPHWPAVAPITNDDASMLIVLLQESVRLIANLRTSDRSSARIRLLGYDLVTTRNGYSGVRLEIIRLDREEFFAPGTKDIPAPGDVE